MKKRYMSSLMAIVAVTALTANVAIAHEGGKAGAGRTTRTRQYQDQCSQQAGFHNAISI